MLVLARSLGRLQGSTQEVKGFASSVWTFRGEKIARWEGYLDRDEARKAVGR